MKVRYYFLGLFVSAVLVLGLWALDGFSEQVMQYRGDWVSTTSYEIQDVVSFKDGCIYVALKPSVNIKPGNHSKYWLAFGVCMGSGK